MASGEERSSTTLIAMYTDPSPLALYQHQERVALYIIQVASEDEATQKKGMVSLLWISMETATPHMQRRQRNLKFFKNYFESAPLRYSAVHFCMPNDPMFQFLKSLFLTVLPKEQRAMTRVHSGMSLTLQPHVTMEEVSLNVMSSHFLPSHFLFFSMFGRRYSSRM
jgi:hypothetical protein